MSDQAHEHLAAVFNTIRDEITAIHGKPHLHTGVWDDEPGH